MCIFKRKKAAVRVDGSFSCLDVIAWSEATWRSPAAMFEDVTGTRPRTDSMPLCQWHNVRCEFRPAGIQQVSTGHLHLDGSSPYYRNCQIKNTIHLDGVFYLATSNGLEPSTSSVTGWRANRLHHEAMCFGTREIISDVLCFVKY